MIHYEVCMSKGFCRVYDGSIQLGAVYSPKATEEELIKMTETIVKEHKENMRKLIEKFQGGEDD